MHLWIEEKPKHEQGVWRDLCILWRRKKVRLVFGDRISAPKWQCCCCFRFGRMCLLHDSLVSSYFSDHVHVFGLSRSANKFPYQQIMQKQPSQNNILGYRWVCTLKSQMLTKWHANQIKVQKPHDNCSRTETRNDCGIGILIREMAANYSNYDFVLFARLMQFCPILRIIYHFIRADAARFPIFRCITSHWEGLQWNICIHFKFTVFLRKSPCQLPWLEIIISFDFFFSSQPQWTNKIITVNTMFF